MIIDKRLMRQIVLYGIIGSCSAFFDFSLFTLLYAMVGMNEFIANTISIHAGIAMSFTFNRKYNFKKTDRILFRAGAFYLTGLFGLLLSSFILWLGGVLSFPILIVKFISIFIVAAVQFTINKLITFGKH
jgi:putative flippase GtrA